jgi:carbon monoxide dehydrogenase subunit G
MKFSQRAVIPAAREPLWNFLMDVPKVAQSLPGVESVNRVDDTTYQGTLKVRVGPIALNLQGKIFLEEQDKERWRAALRAEANDRMAAGAVKGKTTMELKELGPKETELVVETDVNILGKIGEFGQPIIRKKADQMLQQFVDNIKRQLTARRARKKLFQGSRHAQRLALAREAAGDRVVAGLAQLLAAERVVFVVPRGDRRVEPDGDLDPLQS